jgi:phosphonate transport system substrate-binding protein
MGLSLNRIRCLLCLLLTMPAAAWAESEITFGLFPYVTTGQLIALHTPLKNYISETLGRPVVLVTAPDFAAFDQRTHAGDYDLILTAPHFGRVAERRDGYRRLARTLHEVRGVFLVRTESSLHDLADLKGKSVMMAQPLSILYQLAQETLRQHGLVAGKNITVIDTRTHNNALYAPLRNEADVGMTGVLLWETFKGEQKEQLRMIGATPGVAGFMLMAHKRLAPRDVARLRTAILGFAKTPAGERYFADTGLRGFARIDDATMRRLDPYTRVLTQPATP